jgi:hypothetical protein
VELAENFGVRWILLALFFSNGHKAEKCVDYGSEKTYLVILD